jgi:hypothetical protein
MADKEIAIPHSEIADPQTITQVNIEKMAEKGLDIHRHEVTGLEDDHVKGVRHLKVRNRKYFDMGRGKKGAS